MPLYQYTGQAAYLDDPLTSGVTEGFGLMFYNARWYDPYLNHFVQADTIIPGGVQGLDRYAYVRNNPMRMIDPTGHQETEHTEGGGGLYCADGSTAGRSGCGKPDKGEKEVLAKPNEEPYEISPGVYASCHYTGSARTLTCTSVTTYTLTAEQALELQYAIRDRMLTFDQGLGFAFGFIPKWAYEVGIGVANALVVSNLDDVSRMLDDAVYTSLATKEDAQIEVRITQDFVVKVGNEYIVNPTNMIEVNSSNATAASPVFMWSPSGFDLQTLILNVLY
jgi:RHS repeat-associated protein